MVATYTIQPIKNVLSLVPINLYEFIIIILTGIIPVVIIQALKKLKLVM